MIFLEQQSLTQIAVYNKSYIKNQFSSTGILREKQWLLRDLQDQEHRPGTNATMFLTVFSFVNGGGRWHKVQFSRET